MLTASALRAWRETFELYRADDALSGRIRAQHLAAVGRLTPQLMFANAANGVVVAWALHDIALPWLWVWLAALFALVALGLWQWLRWRTRMRTTASRRALHRATRNAAALGAVWGAAPLLWFTSADPRQQLLLGTLVTGMMAGGAAALSPLPAAALAYVAALGASALISLVLANEPLFLLVAALVLTYSAVCALGAMSGARRATAHLRSEHDAAYQGHVVSVLLKDFEQHAAEALWEIDREGRFGHVSPRLAELLGLDAAALLGVTMPAVLHERSAEAAARLTQAFERGLPFQNLRLSVQGQAGPRWWSLAGKPLHEGDGRIEGWRGVIADVTEEVVTQERLRHLAHFDSLTGLANRLTLHEALQATMAHEAHGALVALDLDHFKAINDSLGHSTGDAVLRTVAARLRACVRPGDLVARLGGDEFAVLVTPCSHADAAALGERIVAAFARPCELGGRQLHVGVSIGMAHFPDHGRSVDEVVGNADLALYEAKATGRARLATYEPHLGERSRRRGVLEQALRQALERRRLEVYWQPQVRIENWQIVGAEALVRWEDPGLGRVSPHEFIAVAEQTGLIHELGAWALNEACRAAAGPLQGLAVSINVSAVQLRDSDFAARVRQALRETGLAPQRLELEITESVFIADADGAIERLQALRQLGPTITLDDFGTGYSSLAYLRRFAFDKLKIDRAFVRELVGSSEARAIVRMITQLSEALGMDTVAEGVETLAQLEVVSEAGCRIVQGHVASRPCPLEDFVRLRETWAQRPGQGQDVPRLH